MTKDYVKCSTRQDRIAHRVTYTMAKEQKIR